jgi:hypothetical protein
VPENIKLDKPVAFPSEIGTRVQQVFTNHRVFTYRSSEEQQASDTLHEIMALFMTEPSPARHSIDLIVAYGRMMAQRASS